MLYTMARNVYSVVAHEMVYTGLVLSSPVNHLAWLLKCMSCDILCACVLNYKMVSNLQLECTVYHFRDLFIVMQMLRMLSWIFCAEKCKFFGAKIMVIA